MPQTASPLRYPGGKTVYADMMSEIIHMNNLDGCTFVEAFAGGAGAAITLLLRGDVESIILNDLDPAIYSFWISILNYTDEFIERLNNTPINIREWRRQKNIYLKQEGSVIDIGFATFFLNRSNHAGILRANPVGGLHQSGKYRMTARFNPERLSRKIREIANCRENISIYNLDAVNFIELLNAEYRNNKLLVYFDPPYYQKGELLYLNHYNHDEHDDLSNSILNCRFPWVLSYDDAPEIIALYSDVNIYRRDLLYSVSKPARANELIVSDLNMPEYLTPVDSYEGAVI